MNPKPTLTKQEKISRIAGIDLLQSMQSPQRPYIATTNNIEISVWPEFVDEKESVIGEIFIWVYHIRIQNDGSTPVKLISRQWRIIDERGNISEVTGEGVIGEQPIIAPKSSYQYSSGVHLKYPSGIMTGTYKMLHLESGKNFEVKIPNFSLDSPSSKEMIN